jgi:peptidoglycan/xylan/chitin deacetylase (PgdA/CDA1 family)
MTEIGFRALGPGGFRSRLAERLGTRFLLGAGRQIWSDAERDALSVLIFHRILETPDPLLPGEITLADFRRNMAMLAEYFTVLPLAEAVERLRTGDLPPLAVCLTFDDGYRDNVEVALPVLQEHGLPATFFVATGFLNGQVMWNDRLLHIIRHWPMEPIDLRSWGVPLVPMTTQSERQKAHSILFRWLRRIGLEGREEMLERLEGNLPPSPLSPLMMTDSDVTDLAAAGMEVGCHTASHPILTRVDDATVQREIEESRACLERLVGTPIRFFAYPNGVPIDDYGPQHVDIVRELGFEAAFSTAWGAARKTSDPFQLPRFTPWDRTAPEFAFRLMLSRRKTAFADRAAA